VHNGVLVHKGNVVTVKSRIMHELKVSASSAWDRYYITWVHWLTP